MSDKEQKKYAVWSVVNDKPKSLLLAGSNFISYEIAIEKAIKYIAELMIQAIGKPFQPQGFEDMRWENSKGDKVIISEMHQPENSD